MPDDRSAKIQLFESTHIRSHWDAEREEWFFSIVDVVAALTDSVNPTDYLKKLRKRDEPLRDYIVTNCPQVAMRDYERLGYTDNWINQRLKSIEICKELTDEWKTRGKA